ncbi:hypothetical protein EDD15DRAFT_2197717 [Pisolithus albus]|nr:hypothetical protein EDD15DRAFT_2197717 [Pisolithus albus]
MPPHWTDRHALMARLVASEQVELGVVRPETSTSTTLSVSRSISTLERVTTDRSTVVGDNTLPAQYQLHASTPSPSSSPSQKPRGYRQLTHSDIKTSAYAIVIGPTTWDRGRRTYYLVLGHVLGGDPDPMADVDTSTSDNLRVCSSYPYETQRAEDLSFSPRTYVPVVEPVQATALYSYEGSSPDELSFTEGDVLTIADRLESDWWMAERDGVVYAVPAALKLVFFSFLFFAAYTRHCLLAQLRSKLGSEQLKTNKLDCVPAIIGVEDDDEDDDDYYSPDDDGEARVGTPSGAGSGWSYRQRTRRLQSSHSAACQWILGTSLQPAHLKTTSDSSSTARVGDAFERYETYKKVHGGQSSAANRMSASSFDTASSLAVSSPPRSPATSLLPSLRDREQERGGVSPALPGDPHNSMSSSGFGTSWASLLDRTALEGIPAVERKRQEAIFELISTEADYVRDLRLIVGLFYSRLVDMLEAESTCVIFSNIEDSLLTNTIGALLDMTDFQFITPNSLGIPVYPRRATALLEKLIVAVGLCLREDPSARNLDLSSYAERILEEVHETIRDREGRERLGEVSEELRIGKE